MFLIDMFNKKTVMPTAETALPGRNLPIPTAETHFVTGRPLHGPDPDGMASISLGMGHFWAAERLLWQMQGVWVTVAGYQGGFTPNPTAQETVTGLTGHAEVVKVVYDAQQLPLQNLLKIFFEGHDPTQGMRQGNDIGSAYRSAVFVASAQDRDTAERMRDVYQQALYRAGRTSKITTEIAEAPMFYPAEEYHQQYLARNPAANSALRGTGVDCPVL